MKPQSAKDKGRRLQQEVRDRLRQFGSSRGLVDGDIESRGMGQGGVDVILSPAALKVLPFDIECKNVESLNVAKVFSGHLKRYESSQNMKLLVHRKNHTKPMVTLAFDDFMTLLAKIDSGIISK